MTLLVQDPVAAHTLGWAGGGLRQSAGRQAASDLRYSAATARPLAATPSLTSLVVHRCSRKDARKSISSASSKRWQCCARPRPCVTRPSGPVHSSTRGPHLHSDQEADVVAGDRRAAQDVKVVGALHQERHLLADQPLLQQVPLAHLPPHRGCWAARLGTSQGAGRAAERAAP